MRESSSTSGLAGAGTAGTGLASSRYLSWNYTYLQSMISLTYLSHPQAARQSRMFRLRRY